MTVGHKSFCEEEAKRAQLQVIESNGNVSFIPIVQREDPDLTVYEELSQILLNEENGASQQKKIKFVTSSQEKLTRERPDKTNDHDVNDNPQENENGDENEPFMTLNPQEAKEYMSNVGNKSFCQTGTGLNSSGNSDLNLSAQGFKVCAGNNDAPKSSMPANRKMKRCKLVKPEDITEMEVRRADMEAASAIREAADKIKEAAVMIVNSMQELKPEIKALSNRNYREIQMSTNAVKQLVSRILEFWKN